MIHMRKGDCRVVPAGAEHAYTIQKPRTAIVATAPLPAPAAATMPNDAMSIGRIVPGFRKGRVNGDYRKERVRDHHRGACRG